MKLTRREALVGAVAAVAGRKLPIVEKPIVPVSRKLRAGWSVEQNPWAGALDLYDVHYAIIGYMAQQIAEEEDKKFIEALGR